MNWHGLAAVLVHLDLRWASLGTVSTFGVIAGLAFRWRIFLRQQQIELPFRTIFSLTWAGQFFNSILPGSTGGDLVKIYQVCRLAPDRKAAATSTVLVDRLSALVALVTLAAGALVIDPGPLRLIPRPPVAPRILMMGGAMVLVAGSLGLWLIARASRGSQVYGRVMRTVAAARKNFNPNGNLVMALVLAFAIHLLNFSIIYFFARALRIPVSYGQVLLMMPVILFLVLIPVTINGHGLREVLLIGYFGYLGIVVAGRSDIKVQETAVALSLIGVANDLLWSMPGGLLYLMSDGRRIASNRSAREQLESLDLEVQHTKRERS